MPRIPDPNYDDPKEVYAFYGLAAYTTQLFEQSIILLIVGLEATHPTRTLRGKTFDETFAMLDEKTLGILLREVKKLADVETSTAAYFNDLLAKRNYFVHHFFRDHAENLLTAVGKQAMIDELRVLASEFYEGDQLLTHMYTQLWEKLGFDQSTVEQEIKELREFERKVR